MGNLVQAISGPILLIAFAALGVILFITILKTLKESSFFEGKTAVVVALCVSLLSITGLSQLLAGRDMFQEINDNQGGTGSNFDFILLLYAALGLAILLLLLLGFIARILRSERPKRSPEETKRGRTERRYPFKRASKACEKTDENSRIRR